MTRSHLSPLRTLALGGLLAAGLELAAQEPTPLLTAPESQHLKTLESDSATLKEKMDACRELAVIGTEEAIDVLAGLLADEELSHMARYALEPMPDPYVDVVLRVALKPPASQVGVRQPDGTYIIREYPELKGRPLVGVIASIGVRRDAEAVPHLAERLRASNGDVVFAAAGALGNIGTSAAADTLLDAWANIPAPGHLRLAEGLLRCAEALADKGLQERALAIYDQLRNAAAPHQVRAGALRGAILARGDQGLPLLRESLRNEDFSLAAVAARTAIELPAGPAVTEALLGALAGSPDDHRILILQALGKRGDPLALPHLFSDARTKGQPVRIAAIRALAEFGPDAGMFEREYALEAWKELLRDNDPEIRQAASDSFAALADAKVQEAILEMLAAKDAELRLLAIDLVGRRRMSDAIGLLRQAATAEDAQVRTAAIKMVGELSGAEELDAMLDLLLAARAAEDLDAIEQALATVTGKGSEDDRASARLAEAWLDATPAQRRVLLNVLSALGDAEALATVRSALADANLQIRADAIRALSNWKTADAAPDLLALAKEAERETDRVLALRGYLTLAAQADLRPGERLSMCEEAAELVQRDEEKRLLVATLAGINSPNAVKALGPYLEDEGTRAEASAAVVALAERLLGGRNAVRFAAGLVAPLEKVAGANEGSAVGDQAAALLKKAEAAANLR